MAFHWLLFATWLCWEYSERQECRGFNVVEHTNSCIGYSIAFRRCLSYPFILWTFAGRLLFRDHIASFHRVVSFIYFPTGISNFFPFFRCFFLVKVLAMHRILLLLLPERISYGANEPDGTTRWIACVTFRNYFPTSVDAAFQINQLENMGYLAFLWQMRSFNTNLIWFWRQKKRLFSFLSLIASLRVLQDSFALVCAQRHVFVARKKKLDSISSWMCDVSHSDEFGTSF